MKCVLSFRVARSLLAEGFRIVDLVKSNKLPGRVVYVFEETPELLAELAKMKRK